VDFVQGDTRYFPCQCGTLLTVSMGWPDGRAGLVDWPANGLEKRTEWP